MESIQAKKVFQSVCQIQIMRKNCIIIGKKQIFFFFVKFLWQTKLISCMFCAFLYRITISPPTNFLTKTPTIIKYDQHEFIFEGFSLLSHVPIGELPTCKVIRFNIQYTIMYVEEKIPENFTIKELDLFCKYLPR